MSRYKDYLINKQAKEKHIADTQLDVLYWQLQKPFSQIPTNEGKNKNKIHTRKLTSKGT